MLKKLLITTTLAGLAVGLSCVPAQAALVSTDPIKITEQELDFGGGWWALGAPTNSGVLAWDDTAGQISEILAGTLYINNASGTCARMRVESYDVNHDLVNSRSGGTVCAPDGALHQWSVNFQTPADSDTTHAHVILQVLTNGTYTDVGTEYENF